MAVLRISETDYERHRISNGNPSTLIGNPLLTLLCHGCHEFWHPKAGPRWWACPRGCNQDTADDEAPAEG